MRSRTARLRYTVIAPEQTDPATATHTNVGSGHSSDAAGIQERDVMRILLTLPFHPDHYITTPDLGLGYLASSLKEAGHDVRILITTVGMKVAPSKSPVDVPLRFAGVLPL